MLNPRLAGRYAKSLIDLAKERGQLEAVYADIRFLESACKQSRELVVLLKSPVITSDKKEKIMAGICQGRVSELTSGFNHLLIRKGRESYLPEIIQAFIHQYKQFNGIHIIRLTTAAAVSDALKNAIVEKIQSTTDMKKVELVAEVDEKLIGGFVLEAGDKLVDASIAYDLNKIRSQFLNNDFVYKIR
jgi:F-type H+-transporting ATPase subunit delta